MNQQYMNMSDVPGRKSHATRWTVSALVVLVVYALSWPLVYMKVSSSTSFVTVKGYKVVTTKVPSSAPFATLSANDLKPIDLVRTEPHWVGVLYMPMMWLCRFNNWNNPAAAYFNWWERVLG
jgi:hypothetical protein